MRKILIYEQTTGSNAYPPADHCLTHAVLPGVFCFQWLFIPFNPAYLAGNKWYTRVLDFAF